MALYGTLIADDASLAFIEDKKAPYSTPGRGKRQTTLKKGDHLSGYIVSEIAADRIVLIKGDEKVVVMLDDKGKKRADESPAAPATARTTAVGITSSSSCRLHPPRQSIRLPVAPSSSQAMPSSAPAAVSPGAGIAALRATVAPAFHRFIARYDAAVRAGCSGA